MKIARFTFNPFEENTYILYDDTHECVIIDPGCYDANEQHELSDYIRRHALHPVKLLNTHCHIDHVIGNKFISQHYGLTPEIHPLEYSLLQAAPDYGKMYGFNMEASPEPLKTLADGALIRFGNTTLKQLFTPGHSPGSICFYHEESGNVIGGDVLFQMSIGRTDLPGGNMDTLLNSIRQQLFVLNDEVVVHPGHGPETSIGFEKRNNPFLHAYS